MKQDVVISQNLQEDLQQAINRCSHDKLFVLTDNTTLRLCWPVIKDYPYLQEAQMITIGATDENKNLQTLASVWEALQRGGATRHSLLICLGGGMVTDLGGFAASTFKRGINYINIPTTLLAMVDASVGGKTGINFRGLKNEIGVFNNASSVILHTPFLRTLDSENILSGYAEMLKHGLISNEEMWAELLEFRIESLELTEDPTEKGIRKALNLGHTIGHAFESYALEHKPVLHGYAVAWGLICELYLSAIKTGFPSDKMHQTVNFIKEHYGKMTITCDDYPTLLELMTHDKKNVAGIINFTLLGGIGDIRINQTASKQDIYEALDFYREC